MKKLIFAILLLIPVTVHAFHAIVYVTPENKSQYDIDLKMTVDEQTTKEGEAPARITGYSYRIAITSKKLTLKDYIPSLLLENEESYLHTLLYKNEFGLEKNTIYCDISLSPDYLDRTFIILEAVKAGLPFSYKVKIQDWLP